MISFSSNPLALSLLEVIVRPVSVTTRSRNNETLVNAFRQLGYKLVLVVDLQECPTNPPFLFAV
jgi:hypothetical protein